MLLSTTTVTTESERTAGALASDPLESAAIEAAQEAGIELEAHGYGIAREQSPPPGSHVASGSQVTVKFGR